VGQFISAQAGQFSSAATAKTTAFDAFIKTCLKLKALSASEPTEVEAFILDLLAHNRDARLFEIVSFAVLKFFYHGQTIYLRRPRPGPYRPRAPQAF
jgi:hypothetical protein